MLHVSLPLVKLILFKNKPNRCYSAEEDRSVSHVSLSKLLSPSAISHCTGVLQ